MKKIILLSIILFCATSNLSFSQYISDNRVDSIVNLISTQSVTKFMRELSGDTITMIGGVPKLIFSRFYTSPGNDLAAQYIYEKFQSYGLDVYYQVVDSTCKNVIAVKTGTRFPNQKYVIGAHYDNIIWPINPGPFDTVRGADDNASGVCGVLEAARLLSNMSFDYTIVFAAWDEEEIGLVGSKAYTDSAFTRGDSIKVYINMDMLAWNYNNQNKYWAGSDSNSTFNTDLFFSLSHKYIPSFIPVLLYSENYGSDQLSFISKKYRALNVAEYVTYNNPNYHKITDNFSNANIPYCISLLKPTIATLMLFSLNKTAFYVHKPIVSSYDTNNRIATAIIKFPANLPYSSNAPRLYFKVDNGSYSYINAYYRNLDTFKFSIPGKPRGSAISYYFAAQDSLGSFVCTYPIGGSGTNPPGSISPQNIFRYNIYLDYIQCSNTLPKPINDLQITSDTIPVIQNTQFVNKIKVNLTIYHPDDGDLIIQLSGPDGLVNLSQGNGSGGANYINTTFDDSASISITQGLPPFNGSYKPQSPLSFFSNQPASGNWRLRIYDSKVGNQGSLVSWCILLQMKNSVLVKGQNTPLKYELSQNNPNPFNPVTKISYSMADNSLVKLSVYDVLGKEIKILVNDKQVAGNYEVIFNAADLSSGIYFYRLQTKNYIQTKKMILIK